MATDELLRMRGNVHALVYAFEVHLWHTMAWFVRGDSVSVDKVITELRAGLEEFTTRVATDETAGAEVDGYREVIAKLTDNLGRLTDPATDDSS